MRRFPIRGEIRAVAARLEARRLLGNEVFVAAARYRRVNVALTLRGIVLDEDELRLAIRRSLAAWLDPLIGGAESHGWPFGEPIRVSTLLDRADSLLPDGVAVTRIAASLDADPIEESCSELRIEDHELVHLAEFRVRIERRPATRGGLL